MICAGAYRRWKRGEVEEWPCGKCLPCKMNHKRLWTARLMLESYLHERSCFATLTYDEKHVPGDMSVSPVHLQLFLKRLRKRIEPVRIRYYGVGEYGSRGLRPHYHLAIFGMDRIEDIHIAWNMGFTHVGLLTQQSASYIVGYLLKGLTRESDPRLKGKHPEFCRMSLRPHGIGYGALEAMAESYYTEGGSIALVKEGDVAAEFRVGGGKYPLGRYLRNQLRLLLGRPEGEPEIKRLERLAQLKHDLSVDEAWQIKEGKRFATKERARARMEIFQSKEKL